MTESEATMVRINFQKNHDVNLVTSVVPNRQYLVLVRDLRESIVSWFRLAARKGELEYTQRAQGASLMESMT
jgi:hypothetical protein